MAEAVQSLSLLRQAGRAVGVLGSGRASNEENFLAVTLARSALETGNVDAGLGGCYRTLLSGTGGVDAAGSVAALESADLIVLVEGDLAVSHPRLAFGVMRALRRGGRLVSLGWRRTQMSCLSSVHIPLSASRPLDTLLELDAGVRVRCSDDGGEGRREVDATDPIARAASWLAEGRRVVFLLTPFDGDGAVLRACASVVADMADVLRASDRATVRVLPLPLRANTRGALDVGVVPDRLPGSRPLDDRDARERLQSLWRGQPCWEPGLSAQAMPFSVAGLVVVADDVPAFHDTPAAARDALGGLDSLIVLDSFLTPTARAATIVLPIAAFGEYDGTLTSLEGRVQAWRACQPPPAGVRPGWQLLGELLGLLNTAFAPERLGDVRSAIGRAVPSYAPMHETEGTFAGGGSALPNRAVGGVDRAFVDVAGNAPTGDPAQNGQMTLRREAAFDWGADPLVSSSPILRREPDAAKKLHPDGVVVMNPEDASALGVREGWRVRLTSATGQAEVPVTLQAGLENKVLLVPYVFRDVLAAVSNNGETVEVEVARA